MSSKKGLLFLAMTIIVVAAGCVGGSSASSVAFDQNAGVRINDFSFDVSDLYEKEGATLKLEAQNVGAKTMDADSRIWIYGPVIGSAPAKWSVVSGSLQNDLNTNAFTPPMVEKGIPGAIATMELTLQAPTVSENMQRDDTFYARICYPYQTQSMTKLVSTTRNQYRTENVPQTDAVTRASAGPVQIRMLSGENIVAGRPVTLVFQLTDVGGGFATTRVTECTGRSSADVNAGELNKVRLTVTVDGTPTDCTGTDDITLSKKSATVSCKLPSMGSQSAPKVEYTITGQVDYNYFITESAVITVKSETL